MSAAKTKPNLNQIPEEIAKILADFIDSTAGGIPLISGMPTFDPNALLWQYGKHWFVVHFQCATGKCLAVDDLAEGSPTDLYVAGIEEAIKLIRLTESIRQGTDYPHIGLGRMPGTYFVK